MTKPRRSLALEGRETPYSTEHAASVRRRPETPRSFVALSAWFRAEWEAALPTRMHTRGVEADSALGSPTLAPAVARRTGHATEHGWGHTGWDRDGQPRGADREGFATNPFLHYLERRLKRNEAGAHALVRWAYNGWDTGATALTIFRRTHADGAPILWETEALEALLWRTMQHLWRDCQTEPVLQPLCRSCRRTRCECSDAQIAAEGAA